MKGAAVLAIVLGVWLVLGAPGVELGTSPPQPNPVGPAVIGEPSADLKAAVAPVTAVLQGHPAEAEMLQGYFADFAVVVGKRPGNFKTAGELRAHNAAASDLFTEVIPGAVPGLQSAINGAMKSMLGDDDAAIEPAKAQAALRALSWAAKEAR